MPVSAGATCATRSIKWSVDTQSDLHSTFGCILRYKVLVVLLRVLKHFSDIKTNVHSVSDQQSDKGSAAILSAHTAPNIYNPCSNILKPRGIDPFSTAVLIQYTSLNHVTRSGGLPCPAPGDGPPRDHGILYGWGNSNSVLNYQYIEKRMNKICVGYDGIIPIFECRDSWTSLLQTSLQRSTWQCNFYFVKWPTKAQLQLIYKLSHLYMFRH